ncbi:hypothetical protein BH09ACT8_BH09ACT8_30830 [soil metagenome]
MPRAAGRTFTSTVDPRPSLVIPGTYAKMMATLAAPAEPDPRIVQAIECETDADERDELVAAAEKQRLEENARNRAELARRQRTGDPFRLARWRVIDRAVRDTGAEVADRAYTEFQVSADDIVRPIAKFQGVHREEWTPDGWVSVPSIVRPPVARAAD